MIRCRCSSVRLSIHLPIVPIVFSLVGVAVLRTDHERSRSGLLRCRGGDGFVVPAGALAATSTPSSGSCCHRSGKPRRPTGRSANTGSSDQPPEGVGAKPIAEVLTPVGPRSSFDRISDEGE